MNNKEVKTNINWFPGHMRKALNKISDSLKMVDFVIELLDARIPLSSQNEYVEKLISNKPRLYIFTKKDLSDELETTKWIDKLTNNGAKAIAVSLKDTQDFNKILKLMDEFSSFKKEKALKKGIKNVTTRGLVIGIPNVGKSTLINYLAKKQLTKVSNKPGVTRNIHWVKVNNIELMDTPGILEPQYDNQEKAIKLALIGSIRQEILPKEELINVCLNYLKKYYLNALNTRYKLDGITENTLILEKIAENRGFLLKNNTLDISKAIDIVLNEFKNGIITKFTLDRL